MRNQYSTQELVKKTIEFYYPIVAGRSKYRIIRELTIRAVINNFNEEIIAIEEAFKDSILIPPDIYKSMFRTTPIQKKLINKLYPYFNQYIDTFAQPLISYPASRSLKKLLLTSYVIKHSDAIQHQLVNHYYTNYYNNTRFRFNSKEQAKMGKTLAQMLIGDTDIATLDKLL